MKVLHPTKVRELVRARAAEAGRAPIPAESDRSAIYKAVLLGVGEMFPVYQGRTMTTHKTYNELKHDDNLPTIQWNAQLLLAYLFADENKPFAPLTFKDLTGGQWQGVGRWAGFFGAPARDGFRLECVWLANRGLWAYAYSQRFFQKPKFAEVLRELERAYGNDHPGIVVEPGGKVDTAMRMQSEPITITDENWTKLIGRWREMGGADPSEPIGITENTAPKRGGLSPDQP